MNRSQPSALFVAVEGIEGSGKSTLCAALAERLRPGGRSVLVTREPGGTPLGDAVRGILLEPSLHVNALTEALLVNAARAQHVADAIRPALLAGTTVLCDRYVDSTLAYQGYGRGVGLDVLSAMCDAATGGLHAGVTIVVDVPVAVSRERLRARGGAADRLEREDDAFHERVRRGYLELAKRPSHFTVDGTQDAGDVLARALRVLGAAMAASPS